MNNSSRDKKQDNVVGLRPGLGPANPMLPYWPYYSGDMQKRVSDMNATEIGAFIMLLSYHWDHGSLPPEKDIPRVAHLDGGAKAWRAISERVLGRLPEALAFLNTHKAGVRSTSDKRSAAARVRWERERDRAARAMRDSGTT